MQKFRAAAMAVGMIAVVAIEGAAVAQEQAAPADKHVANAKPGWSVRCDNGAKGLVCKAVQTIVLAKTRQLLLAVSISKANEDGTVPVLLQLPHGLIALDEAKPQKLEIQTCDAKGCYAGTALSAETVAAMLKGQKLSVVFQDLKKQNITIPVPLNGLGEAIAKL